MKKWMVCIAVVACTFFSTGIQALEVEVDHAQVEAMVKNPSALQHIQEGVMKVLEITKEYIKEATVLANRYPDEDDTQLFWQAHKIAKPYLDNPEIIMRAFPLLHAGCFDASHYKGDANALRELQNMILETEVKENIYWDAFKKGELSQKRYCFQIDYMEEECMEKIQTFCQKSPDPFFNQTLVAILKNCEDRFEAWDVLLGDFGFYYDITFDPPWAVNYLSPGEKAFYRLDTQYSKLFDEIYDQYFSPEALLKLLHN